MKIMNSSVPMGERVSSLDVSRGLSIVLMIEAHILIFVPYLTKYSAFFAAPLFLVIAGVSYQLFLQSRIKKGVNLRIIYMETFWRSITLFLVTFSVTIIGILFVPWYYQSIGNGWVNLFNIPWTVFEAISIGYLLGLIIYKNKKLKVIAIFAIFTLSYLISTFHIDSLYSLITPSSFSMNMISFFIFGQLIFEIYNKENISLKNNSKLLIYAISFIAISFAIQYIFPYNFDYENRTKFTVFLMSSSIMLFVMLILIRFIDIKKYLRKICVPFENIGRIAFTAYYLHLLIIFLLKKLIMGHFLLYADNLIILILTVMILAVFEKIWRKYNYVFGLEWTLRKVANIMTMFSENLYQRCVNPKKEHI